MQRHIIEVPQGHDVVRSTVRIEDDDRAGEGMEGFAALASFLQVLVFDPSLLRHATDCPSEVRIHHDGKRWVLEATSFTTRAPDAEDAGRPAPRA